LRVMLTHLRHTVLFFSLLMLITHAGDEIIVPKNDFFFVLQSILYVIIALYTAGFIAKFLPKDYIWIINIMIIVIYLNLLGILPILRVKP
jgi:hypothetical protein